VSARVGEAGVAASEWSKGLQATITDLQNDSMHKIQGYRCVHVYTTHSLQHSTSVYIYCCYVLVMRLTANLAYSSLCGNSSKELCVLQFVSCDLHSCITLCKHSATVCLCNATYEADQFCLYTTVCAQCVHSLCACCVCHCSANVATCASDAKVVSADITTGATTAVQAALPVVAAARAVQAQAEAAMQTVST
jgi:hypothetical protein